MSDVEIYWNAIAAKANDPRKWKDLTGPQQMAIVQSINLLLAVLNQR